MGPGLRPSEQYALAQILVSGSMSHDEFYYMRAAICETMDDELDGLASKGHLHYTLMDYE